MKSHRAKCMNALKCLSFIFIGSKSCLVTFPFSPSIPSFTLQTENTTVKIWVGRDTLAIDLYILLLFWKCVQFFNRKQLISGEKEILTWVAYVVMGHSQDIFLVWWIDSCQSTVCNLIVAGRQVSSVWIHCFSDAQPVNVGLYSRVIFFNKNVKLEHPRESRRKADPRFVKNKQEFVVLGSHRG